MVLLMLAAALGAEPAFEASWERVDVIGDSVHEDGSTWRIVDVGGHRMVRARCEDTLTPPAVQALVDDGDAAIRMVSAWPAPTQDGATWLYDLTRSDARWWAFQGDCTFERRSVSTAPTWLDRAERLAADPADLRARLIASAAMTERANLRDLLATAPDDATWWSTWLAVRPIGGLVSTRSLLRTHATPRSRDPDVDAPWPLRVDDALKIHGPARVHLVARSTHPGLDLCARVDDVEVCQGTRVDRAPIVLADGPLRFTTPDCAQSPESCLDDAALSAPARWEIYVPRGVHTLRFDQDVTIGGRVADPPSMRTVAPLPADVTLISAGGADPQTLSRVLAVPDRADAPDRLLFGPALRAPVRDDEASWIAPGDFAATGLARWWDDDGTGQLRVLASDGTCRLGFDDDTAWVSRGVSGLMRLERFGDNPSWTAGPQVDGCDVRLRVVGTFADETVPREVARPFTAVHGEQWTGFGWPSTPDDAATLRIAFASGAPLVARVKTADGADHRWTLTADDATGGWASADGRERVHTIDLPLDGARGAFTVWLSREAYVSASAPGTPAEVVTQAQDAQGDPADSRALAAAVRDAPDDATRANALDALAARWASLGDVRAAARDRVLADPLGPGDPALQRALIDDILGAWVEGARWVPLGASWVPAVAGLDDATLERAAKDAQRGDAVAVARALATHPESIPWWILAARTQILDEPTALRAWLATSATPTPSEATGPVRAWSRWVGVRSARGTEGWRAPWPNAPPTDTDPFPDAWPDDERARVGDGWVVRLPPTGRGATLPVRCRALSAHAAEVGCTFTRVSSTGVELARWEVAPWGGVVTLTLDPSGLASFLQLEDSGDAWAEVRLPARTGSDAALRDVRRVSGRDGATLDLLGPTGLRVDAWSPTEGALTIEARDADGALIATDSAPIGATPITRILAVDHDGVVQVTVRAPVGAMLRMATRAATQASLEPPTHRALIAALRMPPIAPLPTEGEGRLPSRLATVLPQRDGRPISVLTSLRGGVTHATDTTIRVIPSVTVLSRPTAKPWWFSVGMAVYGESRTAPVIEGHVSAEGWMIRQPLRGWVRVDGNVRGATDPGQPAALRGLVELGGVWRPRSVVEARLSVAVLGAALMGEWPSPASDTTSSVLWSDYRHSHRLGVDTRAELRVFPSPWVLTRLWGDARTNRPGDLAVFDSVSTGLDARFSIPGARFLAGVAVEHKPADLDRDTPWTSPIAQLAIDGMLWGGPRLGVMLGSRVSYVVADRRVAADLTLSVLWSGRPALRDLPPSAMDARQALDWNEPGRYITP